MPVTPIKQTVPGEIVWENHRAAERGGVVERLTQTDEGVVYERFAPPDQQDVFPDLRTKPFPDMRTAVDAIGELLNLEWEDEVPVCELPYSIIVERLTYQNDGYGHEISLGDEGYLWRDNVAMPNLASPIDYWGTDDFYEVPGCDRCSSLFRFDTLTVVDNWDRGVVVLGHHATDEEARERWMSYYVPGGQRGYDELQEARAEFMGEDDDEDDDEDLEDE